MSELISAGVDASLLTKYRMGIENLVLPKIKLITIPENSKIWFLDYKKKLDLSEYDRIILNDIAAIFVAGLYFTKENLDRCVSVVHGSEPEFIFENPTFLRKIIRLKKYYSRAILASRTVLFPSKYMEEKFVSRALSDLKRRIE